MFALLQDGRPFDLYVLLIGGAAALLVLSLLMLLVKRYKRCPSNKVLVIFG